jgi:hypothetical protein
MHDVPGDREFVHLASCEEAAEIVEKTLKQLGRDEVVVPMEDTFAEGPLGDVDEGGASRSAWYRRIHPELPAEDLPGDDSDLWNEVRARSADAMLWHGPHPIERLFALRACWHLRDEPERVYEVALSATGERWRGGRERPAFYDAVAIAGRKVTVRAWALRAKVADVAERARRWETLRAKPGDWIRLLDGETIVQLPVTAFDSAVMDACKGGDWTPAGTVLGTLFARNPIGYSFLTWRIRELLGAGKLEGRGERTRFGLPAELRPASPC